MLGLLLGLFFAYDREHALAKLVVALVGSVGTHYVFERFLRVPAAGRDPAGAPIARILVAPRPTVDPRTSRAAAAFLDVSGILEPTSVAVIGASERPGNLGGDTVRRLVKFGFPGPVWPVNRSGAGRGRACRHSPRWAALPGVPHLAVLAVPAEALLDAVRECAAGGRALRRRLRGRSRRGRRRRAPSSSARWSPCAARRASCCAGRTASGSSTRPCPRPRRSPRRSSRSTRSGPAGSRSSPRAAASRRRALSLIQQAGFGCRHMISSGNEAVVGYADYLYALARDEGTHVIAGYLEGDRRQREARARARGGAAPAEAGRADQGRRDERERPRRAGPHRRPGRRGARGRRRAARSWA